MFSRHFLIIFTRKKFKPLAINVQQKAKNCQKRILTTTLYFRLLVRSQQSQPYITRFRHFWKIEFLNRAVTYQHSMCVWAFLIFFSQSVQTAAGDSISILKHIDLDLFSKMIAMLLLGPPLIKGFPNWES